MKKALPYILSLLTLAGTAFAAFPTNEVSTAVDSSKIDGAFDDFRLQVRGYETYKVTFGFRDGSSAIDLTGFTGCVKVSSKTAGQVDYISWNTTDNAANIAIATSNIVVTIPNTNIPPNNTYDMELWCFDGATTNISRTLGQGKLKVTDSLYDDGTSYPWPTTGDLVNYLPLAGGTMTGAISMGSNSVTSASDGSYTGTLATISYVTNAVAGVVLTNYVTLDSAQTVTGAKIFNDGTGAASANMGARQLVGNWDITGNFSGSGFNTSVLTNWLSLYVQDVIASGTVTGADGVIGTPSVGSSTNTSLVVEGASDSGSSDFLALFLENGATAEPISSLAGVADRAVVVQGHGSAYFVGRDTDNDIEFAFGSSSAGVGFVSTLSQHDLEFRTRGNGWPWLTGAATEAVFNEDGRDYDLRVESDTDTHALFVQGSDGKVGIGTNAPSVELEVVGDITASGTVTASDANLTDTAGESLLKMQGQLNAPYATTFRMGEGSTFLGSFIRYNGQLNEFIIGTHNQNDSVQGADIDVMVMPRDGQTLEIIPALDLQGGILTNSVGGSITSGVDVAIGSAGGNESKTLYLYNDNAGDFVSLQMNRGSGVFRSSGGNPSWNFKNADVYVDSNDIYVYSVYDIFRA